MGQQMSEMLKNRQNNNQKESDGRLERIKLQQQTYNKKMQRVQNYIRQNEINITPYRLTFIAAHHLQQNMQEDEKIQMSQLQNRYQRNTYIITSIALTSSFVIPLPFKYMLTASSIKKFLIGISIFGVTHKSGMYAIQDEVYRYQIHLINKYQKEIMGTDFKLTDS